jgi:hypothetical protein
VQPFPQFVNIVCGVTRMFPADIRQRKSPEIRSRQSRVRNARRLGAQRRDFSTESGSDTIIASLAFRGISLDQRPELSDHPTGSCLNAVRRTRSSERRAMVQPCESGCSVGRRGGRKGVCSA